MGVTVMEKLEGNREKTKKGDGMRLEMAVVVSALAVAAAICIGALCLAI